MDHSTESQTDRKELKKTMSPAEVWALAVGAIIGWGCFVLPGTRFLPDAGPLGTCLAFLIGGGLLCTVALCYSILIKVYPVAGGSFTYAYVGFGTRAGFICGWALVLGYLCVIAANGTALAAKKPVGGAEWRCGFIDEHFYAGFPHLYWAGTPLPQRFTAAAENYRRDHD